MKKSLYLFTVLSLCALAITGCGNTTPDNPNPDDGGNGGEQGGQDTGPKKTITYRSWDLGTETQNNEERRLVKAFEEKENVKVNIVENPGSGDAYWDGIKASIYNKIDVADVMMVPNLDWPLASQYLRNIKSITDADPDFAKIPSSVRDACTVGNGVYSVPARMNLQGYFVNTTVVERDLNIDTERLSCRSEYAKVEEIINAAASVPGVVGLDSPTHFIDTMASVLDTTGTMGYYTWDGAQYHLDSEAFIRGVQKGREFFDAKKTLDAYDEADREALGLDPETDAKVDAWNKGKLAIRYGYTYEIPNMLESNSLSNSYKFIGNPGGKITIVGDYYGIYRDTQEPELAYKFAKWMSFGMDGFKKRMELYEPVGSVNSLPLMDDDTLIDEYFDKFGASSEMSGLEDAYSYIKTKSMVEGVKVVPGYLFARHNKKTGITIGETQNIDMFNLLNSCIVGGQDITSYASQINVLANKTYSDWIKQYGAYYGLSVE